MGTRSIITFADVLHTHEVRPFLCVYQQFDGYLEGVGTELARWLLNKVIVNGISLDHVESNNMANGFGCLLAQYIRDHKTTVGNLYIYPINGIDPQDYNYEVLFNTDEWMLENRIDPNKLITISVNNWGEEPFFRGSPQELLDYIEANRDKDNM